MKFETEAGFCHFPMEADCGYNEQYFEGLTAERRQIHTVNGQMKINWVLRASGARNEPFDIRNYATAALEILNPNLERLYERQNKHIENTVTFKRSRGCKGVEIWKEE